jgi:hypothetical protein
MGMFKDSRASHRPEIKEHRMKGLVVATFTILAGSQASADVVLVSQSRTVTARVLGATVSHSAPAFGPWNGNAGLVSTPDFPIFGSGQGTQDSTILSDRISATGTVLARDDVQAFFGSGESNFSATFDVVQPQIFSFSGNWIISYAPLGLTSTAVMLFERTDSTPETLLRSDFRIEQSQIIQSESVSLSGDLAPGRYRLSTQMRLHAALNPGFVAGNGSYSFDLQVPAPGSFAALALLACARRRR